MYIIIVPPKNNKLNMFEVVLTRNPDSEEKGGSRNPWLLPYQRGSLGEHYSV